MAQATFAGANGYRRAVHIAQGSDGRVGQHRACGAQPLSFVAVGTQNPAENVKIVNQHVAEDAARGFDVFSRWRAWVAAGDDEHFRAANFTGNQAAAGVAECRVKAALKTNHASHIGIFNRLSAGLCTRNGQVDRFFAKNMLTCSCCSGDEVAVGVCRRANGNGGYAFVRQNSINRRNFCPQLLRDFCRRCGHRVADVFEFDASECRDVGCVNATDAASAENSDVCHVNSSKELKR